MNTSLPWSLELIERFEDRWGWNWLSENKGLPWSLELIERFEERWCWIGLSMNKALPWSLELIERFEERWHWDVLSKNEGLPWSLELIERFEERWCWMALSPNESLHLPTLRPADIVAIMEHHFGAKLRTFSMKNSPKQTSTSKTLSPDTSQIEQDWTEEESSCREAWDNPLTEVELQEIRSGHENPERIFDDSAP
ncbi:hypothetical protein [Methylobacter psychrophilus]|uniref:hypothetical protein n=1 Tax=Methylobacter psychrophilus TaxID=96941 RepID=UPI0021D491D8|nr:hypothetical protein [Methylobacter psychrophilus]